jgi:hypothetical protein
VEFWKRHGGSANKVENRRPFAQLASSDAALIKILDSFGRNLACCACRPAKMRRFFEHSKNKQSFAHFPFFRRRRRGEDLKRRARKS